MRRLQAFLLAASVSALAGGCMSSGSSGSSSPAPAAAAASESSFMNIFKYGGTTKPEPMKEEDEDIECPSVQIMHGTAAMRQEGAGSVRHQFSISQTARECRVQGNDIVIKIGVEGRVLLGPAGSPGTFTVPVRFVAKRGDKVVASKLQRQTVSIPSGETGASFVAVEDGMAVPKDGAELEIFVGLDGSGGAAATPTRKKR